MPFASLLLLIASLTPTVPQILDAHVKAIGGLEKIYSIKSVIIHGYYHEGDYRNDDTWIVKKRPFFRVIGDPSKLEKDEVREGFDGSSWEYYADPGIVVRTIGAAARTTRNSAPIEDILVDPEAHGTKIEYVDEETVTAKPCYKLRATLPDESQKYVYVDKQTSLIDAVESIAQMHAFGEKIRILMVTTDYREAGGILWPFSENEVDADSGKVLTESGKIRIEINPKLSDAIFSPPVWQRTPLQQMIQKLYDQRDEASSVFATYMQYRPLLDFKSDAVGAAVDFTGYQCLKMGHTDTTIALLTANVADHPNMPRAHFGLGRAYATAGRKDEAKAEFEKALAIDPSYKRAKDGLADLAKG